MSDTLMRFQKKLQIANCKLQTVNWQSFSILILQFAFCNLQSGLLVAQDTVPTASATTTAPGQMVYEISRLRNFDDPRLPVALITAGAIALMAIVWYLYRRDTVELSPPVRIGVALLRTVALAGLLVFFLGIERRTTSEIVHNSQVAVLVDVSQSMGLSAGDGASTESGSTRIAEVTSALADSPLLAELQQTHDVNIARFDRDAEPVVTLQKAGRVGTAHQEGAKSTSKDNEDSQASVAVVGNAQTTHDFLSSSLQPRGVETRLGQALADQLRLYRNAPLAGIVVISDGAQNAGVEPAAAIDAAREAKVPVYTVGVGSTEVQRNIALRDLIVPARAFPGDTADVTGYLQANGYKGRLVEVELTRRRAEDPAGGGTRIDSEQVAVGDDNEMVAVSFEIEPDEVGTFIYQLRLAAPPDDANSRDNQREAEVDVVERKTRVLLFASGPMRDYQYLRNQLYRDRTMTVDVYLQIAQPGISQEANKILDAFPSTPEELYEYDCIVAFDPDWTELDSTQIELLEKWIAEEAGGLITVAGPIHTGKWIRSTEHAQLRDLYPVAFQERLTLLDDGHYSSDTAWPLALERAGREAKFLWLEKTAEESEAAWDSFPGVYGYYAVKGEKPGATVYARFSDPEAGLTNLRPVYFASHFYGAGQVFYIGSGEMWRLRRVDPAYFEVLYTKLIRHVSQGRILRGSARGALLVERDRYELGETVVIRARLADAQHKPLEEASVTAQLLRPDGVAEPVKLTAETDRPGMYIGQATVLQEGTYQISLSVPGGGDEPLGRYLQVRVPDLERTRAERNEQLLAGIAADTGGVYYKSLATTVDGDENAKPLAQAIPSRAEVKLLKGAPDQKFAQAQMQWLLGVIAGSLFLEWIVRRLNRLA
jgi:hypothetical protein